MPLDESQLNLIQRRLLTLHDADLTRLRNDFEAFRSLVNIAFEKVGISLDEIIRQASKPKPTPQPTPRPVPVFVDAWTELCLDDSEVQPDSETIIDSEIVGRSTANAEESL